jgi:hypothetical protein
LENMKQDKAIFMSQCRAFPYKNNEILVHILPFKSAFYLIPIPYSQPKKFNMKKITLLFAMTFSAVLLYAQNEKPSTVDSDLKREIGIDMQGLFNGSPGGSLIYKVRDKKQPINGNYVKNCRYQLAMSGRLSLASKSTLEENSDNFISKEKSGSTFYIHPQIGMERIKMLDRFGFFYGADTGPFYQRNSLSYSVNYPKDPKYQNGSALARPTTFDAIGWSFTPFFGMKYKLNNRFSLSIETGFNLNYTFTNTSYYVVKADQGIFTQKIENKKQNHELSSYMDFLRFLTFNYHF